MENNNKYSEQRSKHYRLKCHLLPAFGTRPISEITAGEIERYKAQKLQAGLSPKTINNQLTVLRKCLDTAVEWGRLATIPKVRWLRVPPQKFDFLTTEESDRLLAAAAVEPFWYVMILCCLRTGLRFGEALGLRWEDLNPTTEFMTVSRSMVWGVVGSPKSNRTRAVPMPGDLSPCFSDAARRAGWIFRDPSGRAPSYNVASRALTRMCRRAGLRHITWHSLRHSRASQGAAKGENIRHIQECLGHTTLQMTMRYTHTAQQELREAVRVIETPFARRTSEFVGTTWAPVLSREANDPISPFSETSISSQDTNKNIDR